MTSDSQPTYRRTIDYWFLWLFTIASIILNVYLINLLTELQTGVQEVELEVALGALEVAAGVRDLRNAVIEYNVVVDETIPVSMVVPINMTVPVDINEEIDVNTTVFTRVPALNLPINFPISTTIPVDIETTVPINENVLIDDTIPVFFEVPIRIAVAETEFVEAIDNAYYGLLEFARQLGAPESRLPADAPTTTAPTPVVPGGTQPTEIIITPTAP